MNDAQPVPSSDRHAFDRLHRSIEPYWSLKGAAVRAAASAREQRRDFGTPFPDG
jgi:hypothetical protein